MITLPETWTMSTVGQMISFVGGSQPPRSVFVFSPKPGYIRLIQIRDYRTNDYKTYIPRDLARKFCVEEDIMIGRYGPPIFQIFKGLTGAYNVALIKATPKKGLLKEYSWHFLKNPNLFRFIDSLSQRSSGQTGIEMDELKAYPLLLPSIEEQKKICMVLDSWDRAIDLTERLIAEKQERRKGLMQQLLTGKKRLPGFDEEWREVQINEIFKAVRRKNTKGISRVLTASGEYGLIDQTKYFNRSVVGKSIEGYFHLHKGEFAYNRSSMNGYPYGAIKRLDEYEEGVLSTLYICFAPARNDCCSDFYKHLFEGGILNEQLRKVVHVGARAHGLLNVTLHDFFSLKVVCPTIEEQEKIAEFLNLVDEEIHLLEGKLHALKEQKKGLMQQLLTGKKRVKV